MSRGFQFCPQCAAPLVPADRDGITRQVCDAACGYIHWNNPIPVVAAIVEHDGDIILAHNRQWPANWYGLITGFLEAGETPDIGVLREVKEELALEGVSLDFVGHYEFSQMNQLLIAYHVVAKGDIVLNEELDDYRRVPPNRLKPWRAGTGQAVADWLASRHGINFGGSERD